MPMPKDAAIFLDRDGTIVEDVGYVRRPEELVYLPGAIQALRRLGERFRLFIVTNQPGLSTGAIRPDELQAVHDWLCADLADQGIRIEEVFHCPHERREGCGCIKPRPFFLDLARRKYGLDLSASYVIGDHPHDIEFAWCGGARGIYLLTGHGRQHRPDLPEGVPVADDLWQAAEMILTAPAPPAAVTPSDADYARAVELLRTGQTVAFPTETVYGLGANALDAAAVGRMYQAKGRPAHNPLIVHVADAAAARELAADFPPAAVRLAERFWPGPLTLVLPKASGVPDVVTAGLDSVAVRVPDHPVAMELLRRFGGPLAAPSANRSGQLSPTTAAHVREGLGDAVGMVLDGGPCRVGVESTIVSLMDGGCVLLRPGGIGVEALRETLGQVRLVGNHAEDRPLSPGRLISHYRPHTPLVLSPAGEPLPPGRVGLLCIGPGDPQAPRAQAVEVLSPTGCLHEAAAGLFAALHRLDALGLDVLVARPAPPVDLGLAINERLSRAAGAPAGE